MKCFCVKNRIEFGEQEWMKIKAEIKVLTGQPLDALVSKEERHNCNECKHRLACLIDPGCNRQFESK